METAGPDQDGQQDGQSFGQVLAGAVARDVERDLVRRWNELREDAAAARQALGVAPVLLFVPILSDD